MLSIDTAPQKTLSPRAIAECIDHTVLRPEAKESEIILACVEALQFDFKGVCVELKWLEKVVAHLKGSSVLPVTVIAFPHGVASTAEKIDQAKRAMDQGAKEVDMVLNRILLKERNYPLLYADIKGVVAACPGACVKVILETSEVSDVEKVAACAVASSAGAAFVKTSTGFSSKGATESDVSLMRETVGKRMGVKASGGIRSYSDAVAMLKAGANRLGCSASVAIVKEALQRLREAQ